MPRLIKPFHVVISRFIDLCKWNLALTEASQRMQRVETIYTEKFIEM